MNPFDDIDQPIHCILVFDNAAVHMKPSIINLCSAVGVKCLFLPPYSYDLNPIERCHHYAKDYIRRTHGDEAAEIPLCVELRDAFYTAITPEIACNTFDHYNYRVSEVDRRWALE